LDEATSFGPYELLGKISTGGMAEVYRARDARTGTLVALKRILPSVASDEEFVTMFRDEARIAAELDHPHIARLLDYEPSGEHPYIAYELVDGQDLRTIATRAIDGGGPLPLPFLLYVFGRIADGLAYAHARRDADGQSKSIVHRDVSPQNIVISFTGDVKLIDFGIAKAKGKVSRTATGTLKGKLGYMSPEQVRGGDVDQRTDVFSLGICMWELLTLKRLFTGPNEILVLDMVKRHVPDPPSAMRADLAAAPWGGELDRIVSKALAKERDERYRSARELSKDLDVFVEKSGAIATREEVARSMGQIFGTEDLPRSLGRNMLQETRMSDDNKGGSDLDIFEGLGKKSSARTSAAPPLPPGSGANVPAAKPSDSPQGPAKEMKKTLLGIPGPAGMPGGMPAPPPAPSASKPPPPPPTSGSMRVAAPAGSASQPPAAASKPPPPPGRGSLPNIATGSPSQPPAMAAQATSPSATMKSSSAAPPPAPSTRPTALAGKPPTATPSAKLDMDWDDEDEATHVFDKDKKDEEKAAAAAEHDKDKEKKASERADMDAIMSAPPRTSSMPAPAAPPTSQPPAPAATLSGAFGALGEPRTNGAASASFRSSPPTSQSMRSAPPPPPGSQRIPSHPPQMGQVASVPPPPPPGQVTTAPMHMPPTRPVSAPPAANVPSAPPAANPYSQPPMASQPPMQMPPTNRNMEATAMVPRPQPASKAGPVVAVLLGIAAVVGLAVFFLMPRTGTLVVNVADAKGGAVDRLEILVDGTTKCTSAPCIIKDESAGVHEVKVVAQGFEPPAPRAVTVEARKDATTDFNLVPSAKSGGGTGIKVAGNQPGVKLSIDGKEIGPLPQEIHDLTPGEHKLHFAGSERYQPLDKTISVGQDEIVDVGSVSLKVLKGKAMIQLGTPGAKVYLVSGTNRKEVPQFPIAIDFDPNEKWQLEGKLAGYEEFIQPISFDDGQAEKTYTVTLTPKSAAAAPQPHTQPAAVSAPKTEPKSEPKAEPKSEPKSEPKAAAGGGEAFLNINSLPASTVVLDGRPLGPTPKLHVSVAAGSHTILFINSEQSLKKSISVSVGAGETKAAFAKLRD
jgi:serine/threonine protein kinase